MESKRKFIEQLSNDIIVEKMKEWMDIIKIIEYLKWLTPKNKIEERVLRRSVCILYGYIMCVQGKFQNRRLIDLLSILQKK